MRVWGLVFKEVLQAVHDQEDICPTLQNSRFQIFGLGSVLDGVD